MGHKARILAVVMVLGLVTVAGCNTNKKDVQEPSTSEVVNAKESEAVHRSSDSEDMSSCEGEDEKYIIKTEFGDYIDLRNADNIKLYTSSGKEITLNEAIKTDDVYNYLAYYSGFSYMTKSRGISYNSIDDTFDQKGNKFTTEIEYPEHEYEYFKVSVGDKFENLVVKEAKIYFEGQLGNKENQIAIGTSLGVLFSGDLAVKGHISIAQPTNDYYGFRFSDRFISFFVDTNSWGNIPVIPKAYYKLPELTYRVNNFQYSSDIKMFYLWESADYSSLDLTIIPNDGSFAYVDVVIYDLEMTRVDADSGEFYRGNIKSMSLISY